MKESEFFESVRLAETQRREDDVVIGMMIPGLRRYYAWDWAAHQIEQNDDAADLSVRELQAAADGYTNREEIDFLDKAKATLARYAETHGPLPKRDSWWRGFWQGVAAAAAWSVFLLLIYIAVRIWGSDLGTALHITAN